MRKIHLFSAVFSLFLLVHASITRAQVTKTLNGVVRYESGKSTSTFETPKGNVSVMLPQSLCGATISGTVSVEPSGKTEKEKSRNLKDLLQYTVMLDGQKIPLSSSPAKFDWLTHMDRQTRTPMELLNVSGAKVAELSLPPVLKAPATVAWTTETAPEMSWTSKVLVKGDALNVYSDRPISPGVKFVLTDPRGNELFVQPLCQSSNQAVLTIPDGVVPGYCKIRMEESEVTIEAKPGNKANAVGFQLIDISLTSPNTNLRPGQISNVLVTINTSLKNMGSDASAPLFFDLRNLNPNIVTMEGGNLQRVNLNLFKRTLTGGEQTYLEYQLQKTITGNAVGTFSVSATLHEDYSSSNDPFRPQLNVLKTPEDFNAWSTAMKKDLKGFAEMHDNDLLGQAFKTNTQRAIDNMPVCSDPGQLDESKAVAYSLVQPLHVPMGAAINWPSSNVATKAAAAAIDNNIAGNTSLIDYDVLKNGTAFIHRMGEWLKDGALQNESSAVQQLIEQVQTNGETKENLQQLRDNVNALTVKAGLKIKTDEEIIIKTGMKDIVMASYQLPSLAQPGDVHPYNDVVAILDPRKKVLMVLPDQQQMVLNRFNAVPAGDGRYQIQTINAYRRPVSMIITVMPALLFDFTTISQELVDSLNAMAKRDTSMGTLINTFVDSTTGTWCRVFKNAKCTEVGSEFTTNCTPDAEFKWDPDKKGIVEIPPSKYYKMFYPAAKSCKKGIEDCVEVLAVWSRKTYYYDAECKLAIGSKEEFRFMCR